MANNKQWLIYALVGVLALYFLVPGVQTWAKGLFDASAPSGGSDDPWAGKCLEHSAITMTLGPVQKKYDPGNSADPKTTTNTVYDRVIIDGIDKGLKEDGTTLTVSAGQKVCVYYAENASGSDFYAAKSCFEVPCVAAFSSASYGDVNAYKLVAIKNVSVTVFNDDDSLKNTAANNETIVHDDESSMNLVVNYPGVGGVAPYGKWYLNVYANTSQFDEITLTGTGVVEASPSTYRTKSNTSAGFGFWTFAIPGRDGQGAYKESFTLGFRTGSSGLALDTAFGANVSISYDDDDWYRNTDTGEMILGPSDNDKTDVGASTNHLYSITFNSA